jgi:hypothetical protein
MHKVQLESSDLDIDLVSSVTNFKPRCISKGGPKAWALKAPVYNTERSLRGLISTVAGVVQAEAFFLERSFTKRDPDASRMHRRSSVSCAALYACDRLANNLWLIFVTCPFGIRELAGSWAWERYNGTAFA